MGFRFQKRISIAPGISLNIGKTGTSVSIGPRGCKTTIGKRGIKHSYGIPGTGIRYETPYKPIGGLGGRTSGHEERHPEPYGRYETVSFWEKVKRFLGFYS